MCLSLPLSVRPMRPSLTRIAPHGTMVELSVDEPAPQMARTRKEVRHGIRAAGEHARSELDEVDQLVSGASRRPWKDGPQSVAHHKD